MRPHSATQEETIQQIKDLLFKHGVNYSTNILLARLSVARMTTYKWFEDAEGIRLVGIRGAHEALMERLGYLKTTLEDPTRKAAKDKDQLADSCQYFLEYCRLLEDPKICGNLVHRAIVEFPDPKSPIHIAGSNFLEVHIRFLAGAFRREMVGDSISRARVLVAAATGLYSLTDIVPHNVWNGLPMTIYRAVREMPAVG